MRAQPQGPAHEVTGFLLEQNGRPNLAAAGIDLDDIDYVLCAIGPRVAGWPVLPGEAVTGAG